MRPWRLGATLLAMFSAVALGVAALGLYAAFTHAVNERRREIAIRLAVGAEPRGMVKLVLRDALTVAGIGIICGAIGVVATGRWVQSLLFDTAPTDPRVLACAALVMLTVATIATLAPARAAAKNDPSALLRAE
jgi:ABC-type antimicrobial peptide transport system permease subunit